MASLSWPGFCFSDVFANKRHVAPKLSLVNVAGLNKVLRSEVFVSEERQLRAIHLILDFKPLLENFQDVGHAIRAGDPLLARIDVLVLGFLAWEDLIPVKLPFYRSLCEVAILREETAEGKSGFVSHTKLIAEVTFMDLFHLWLITCTMWFWEFENKIAYLSAVKFKTKD